MLLSTSQPRFLTSRMQKNIVLRLHQNVLSGHLEPFHHLNLLEKCQTTRQMVRTKKDVKVQTHHSRFLKYANIINN